ncbi:MAG: ABC transporter substrate-binding protein, partial [Chloroflexia bacterium]
EVVAPDTFNVTLREGVKWSDGKPFTSKDVVTTFQLLRLQNGIAWNYLGSVAADGDYGVTFKMKDPSSVVQRYVLREHIRSDATYNQWATQAQALFAKNAASDSKEVTDLRTKFEEFRPQMVVSGPYKIDTGAMTEAQLSLSKVPTAWNANIVQFDKIVLYNGETPAVTPIVLSKQVDYATHGFPPATEKAFEALGIRVVRPPVYSGPALFFNYAKVKAVADPRVRQAIAMAINKETNATISLGESAKVSRYMTGVADSIIERWVSEQDLAAMKPYEFNLEAANQLMGQAGFKKEGGVWARRRASEWSTSWWRLPSSPTGRRRRATSLTS